MTVEPGGGLLVCNQQSVLRVDPVNGVQSTLGTTGIAGVTFSDIEFEGPDSAVVSDPRLRLWRLDTANGDLTQFYEPASIAGASSLGIA